MYNIKIIKAGDPDCVHNEYINSDTMFGVCRKCGRTKFYEKNMLVLDPVDVEGYWADVEIQQEKYIRRRVEEFETSDSW